MTTLSVVLAYLLGLLSVALAADRRQFGGEDKWDEFFFALSLLFLLAAVTRINVLH